MSFKAMLRHRATVYELSETFVDGVPTTDWVEVSTGVRCFVDLNFIRKGKDPLWTPEAGRPSDRSGVAFFLPGAPVASGQRIKVTRGPKGMFQIEGAVDEAWQPTYMHHLEVGITEVPKQISKGQEAK